MITLLHPFHEVNLGAWHFEPTVISGTFIVVSFYLYGVFSRRCVVPWRMALFFAGVTLMVLSLVSPLDAGADRLLSLHMLQHVFLTTLGPPLVLLGLPPGLLGGIFSSPRVRDWAQLLFSPVVAATVFVVTMWVWHVPPVYNLAVTDLSVHIVMHLAFMATGIMFWWPVIQPAPELKRNSDGARLLYLLATGMPMALLAVMFFASGNVIYDHYDRPDPLWGVNPMDDQQIAGLIMGGLGEFASFVVITWLFFRFLDREEQEAVASVADGRPGDAAPTSWPGSSR